MSLSGLSECPRSPIYDQDHQSTQDHRWCLGPLRDTQKLQCHMEMTEDPHRTKKHHNNLGSLNTTNALKYESKDLEIHKRHSEVPLISMEFQCTVKHTEDWGMKSPYEDHQGALRNIRAKSKPCKVTQSHQKLLSKGSGELKWKTFKGTW